MNSKDKDSTTVARWLQENTLVLKDAGIESARLDCLLLLEDELQTTKEWLLAHSDHEIEQSDLLKLNTKIVQRSKRIPLAYVRNQQEFYGRPFYVNENVLIPRPESEAIIELLLSTNYQLTTTIYDVGTGSGCLAITVKLELPDARIIATDLSNVALDVAKKNAKNLNAEIEFTQADLIPTSNLQLPTTILANLPYVPDDLITSKEIESEPALALFSGPDGMDLYCRFWIQLQTLNHQPNYVITESLENQHEQMERLANMAGYVTKQVNGLAQLFTPIRSS